MAIEQYSTSRDEQGASGVEYGMLVALIGLVIVGGLALLSGELDDFFIAVADDLAAW